MGLFALVLTMGIFNTVLGEELLFRGLLLPRMRGAFGDRDWLANGLLFAVFHLHMPWVIPASLLDPFIYAYPAKRYNSALVSIAVHSGQTVLTSVLVLTLVLEPPAPAAHERSPTSGRPFVRVSACRRRRGPITVGPSNSAPVAPAAPRRLSHPASGPSTFHGVRRPGGWARG